MKARRLMYWGVLVAALAVVAAALGPPAYRWAYAAIMPAVLLCEGRNDTSTDIVYRVEDAWGGDFGKMSAPRNSAGSGPLSSMCSYAAQSRSQPVQLRWGEAGAEGYANQAQLRVPRPGDAAVLLLRFTAPDKVQVRYATKAEMPEPATVPESVWNSGKWVSE